MSAVGYLGGLKVCCVTVERVTLLGKRYFIWETGWLLFAVNCYRDICTVLYYCCAVYAAGVSEAHKLYLERFIRPHRSAETLECYGNSETHASYRSVSPLFHFALQRGMWHFVTALWHNLNRSHLLHNIKQTELVCATANLQAWKPRKTVTPNSGSNWFGHPPKTSLIVTGTIFNI